MHRLSQYRLKYGNTYITVLPDGTEIPWRPLNLQEFIDYDFAINSGRYTYAVLEDEIFKRCVTDKFRVDNIDQIDAGVISTVVGNILAASGPPDFDQFNSALSNARVAIQHPLHQVVEIICRGFPAYKPEEVYALDYDTMMLRLALAEQKLLQLGLLTEPLVLLPPGAEPKEEQKQPQKDPERLRKMKERLAELNPPAAPVTKPRKTVIRTVDEQEAKMGLSGHELQDYEVLKAQALKGIENIYPQYIEMMKQGKKLTPDDMAASDEQRKEEYYKKIEQIKAGKMKPAILASEKPPERPTVKRKVKRR